MTNRIRTLLLAAVSAISIAGAAKADILCNVTDTQGNHLTYVFGGNSTNSNGSFGGTMVETGFKKNGKMTVSDVGVRPIWTYNGNVNGGYNLHSRAAPGWTISVANGAATLGHNGNMIAIGSCTPTAPAVTQDNVSDQGL